METSDFKKEARRLIDDLPDTASWDDLMYKIYVCQAIDAGLEDSKAGRTIPIFDVRNYLNFK